MKTMIIQFIRFLASFWVILGVACQPTSTTSTLFTPTSARNTPIPVTATPKAVFLPTRVPTIAMLPTIQFIPTSTATFTPEPTATSTPLPTLSPDEAVTKIQRLYATNNGCLLPCWWGIIPGTTDWETARHFLAQLSSGIIEQTNPDFPGIISSHVNLLIGWAPHRYIVDNGIVIKMEGYIPMTPLFDPTTILATYGPPSEVRFSASVGGDTDGMTLFVFYPQHGFLLQYQIGEPNAEVANGVLHGCFVDATTYLVVWSPTETFTLSERLENTTQFNYYDHIPGRPLEEATGMTIETFYQTFQNAEPPLCLDTPESLWPGY